MECATEFADYLPYTPMSPDGVEFNGILIDQLAANYETGQYDFTVLACHLVTMQVTYYKLWQSNRANPIGFRTAVENIKDSDKQGVGNYPTDFSRISERNAVKLLRTLGIPSWAVTACIQLVDEPNSIAHPSGKVKYRQGLNLIFPHPVEGIGPSAPLRSCFISDGNGPCCHLRADRTHIPAMAAAVSWVCPFISFCLSSALPQ